MRKSILFILAALSLASCRQDAIFFAISLEVVPIKPFIQGAADAVCFKDLLYAYSRGGSSLYYYNKGTWKEVSTSGIEGRLYKAAATDSTFYVLAGEIGSLKVWKTDDFSPSLKWEEVTTFSSYKDIQTIYAAKDTLFVGQRIKSGLNEEFAILSFNGTAVSPVTSSKALLTGAAFGGSYYYLSTAGNGILYSSSNSSGFNVVSDTDSLVVNGITALDDGTIAAAGEGVFLYNSTSSNSVFTKVGVDIDFSGGIATVEKDGDKFLILGVGYASVYGYREIVLEKNSGALPSEFTIQVPGKNTTTTLHDAYTYDRFASGLGLYPVTGIFQGNDDKMLFASTYQNGLWSYRYREDGWQWNAEQ